MGVPNGEVDDAPAYETICELLDKLTLRQLHLMEDKMRHEINIETHINNGNYQLAKSRYIMGHSSICATKLPIETSPEFAASTVCECVEDDDGVKQLRAVENDSEYTVNPIRWFGVLVPQNLYAARSIFRNAVNYAVECVNVQLLLSENGKYIAMLRDYKNKIKST